MAKRTRYGYLCLDSELAGKRQPRIWVSQKSVFSSPREKPEASAGSRIIALAVLLAVLAGVYFKLHP